MTLRLHFVCFCKNQLIFFHILNSQTFNKILDADKSKIKFRKLHKKTLSQRSHFFADEDFVTIFFYNCDLAFVSYYVLLLNGRIIMYFSLLCCAVLRWQFTMSGWLLLYIYTNKHCIWIESKTVKHYLSLSVCVREWKRQPDTFVLVLTDLAFNYLVFINRQIQTGIVNFFQVPEIYFQNMHCICFHQQRATWTRRKMKTQKLSLKTEFIHLALL